MGLPIPGLTMLSDRRRIYIPERRRSGWRAVEEMRRGNGGLRSHSRLPGRTGRETVDPTMDRLCRLLAEFPKSPRQGLAGFLGGLAALEWSLADLLSPRNVRSPKQ